MRTRVVLGAAGVVCGLWGVWLLVDATPDGRWLNLVLWLGGGVLVHDLLIAPCAVAAGWLAGRLLPARVRGPVVGASFVLGALTLTAVPVLGGWGRRADNPTILDRDYGAGWLTVAGLVVVGLLISVVRSGRDRGGAGGIPAGHR